MKSRFVCFALSVIAVASSQATILTFDYSYGNATNVNQTYGDNVTATTMGSFGYGVGAEGFTQNVAVDYGNSAPRTWNSGYADLTRVLYEDADGSGILTVTLTADAGYLVTLHDFDLGAYSANFSADPVVQSIAVKDGGGNSLYSLSNSTVSESSGSHTHLDLNALSVTASSLVLTIDARNLGNLNDDIAVDNLRFSQSVVPEPVSLAVLPLCLLALKRRRRS